MRSAGLLIVLSELAYAYKIEHSISVSVACDEKTMVGTLLRSLKRLVANVEFASPNIDTRLLYSVM